MRNTVVMLILLFAAPGAFCSATEQAAMHPLDPLSAEEISAVVSILQDAGKVHESTRFSGIALSEPPKEEVLKYNPGTAFGREAAVSVVDLATGEVDEGQVDLRAKTVISWNRIAGVQAPQLLSEFEAAIPVVRAYPEWQAAMKRRGITDFEKVEVEAWAPGYLGEDWGGRRVFRCLSYYKGSGKNYESRPIEGVIVLLDAIKKEVLSVTDTGVVPVEKEAGEYAGESVGPLREPLRPLRITQPEGTNFTVTGNEITWQNWSFRFALHPRQGLVLYMVGYRDQGKVRSILYRASLAEMVVPYGDPDPNWSFRSPFDEGEYGIGLYTGSLEPNADVPENAQFFSAVLSGETGAPVEIPRAVAVYERDGGIQWRHWDLASTESRRARDLVLSSIATIGNYDYGFNWIFHQDGSLDMEVQLTGLMLVKGVDAPSKDAHHTPYGHFVAPNISATHHQHFFCFRLDFDIDRPEGNNVLEWNTASLPRGKDNPQGNAFTMTETPLRTEREAQRDVNMASSRKWKVAGSAAHEAPGYLIVPGENSISYMAPDSWVRKRAPFLSHHLWVTPYAAAENYAAGDYVNQSRGGDGLSRWTQADRSIAGKDVVVWYNFGVTHIPRPEEWPIMSVHRAGFKLMPAGFFARNPSLDLPPPK